MVRELIPDYVAEEFFQKMIPSEVFEPIENPKKAPNQCIVFCKKVAPNVYDIKKGLAVIDSAEENFNDGICMVVPAAKVVFIFE